MLYSTNYTSGHTIILYNIYPNNTYTTQVLHTYNGPVVLAESLQCLIVIPPASSAVEVSGVEEFHYFNELAHCLWGRLYISHQIIYPHLRMYNTHTHTCTHTCTQTHPCHMHTQKHTTHTHKQMAPYSSLTM